MSKTIVSSSSSSGIGFGGALFLVFLVLKLCGVIDWSWWWVTAPLWGPFAILGIVLVFVLVIMGFCGIVGLFLK